MSSSKINLKRFGGKFFEVVFLRSRTEEGSIKPASTGCSQYYSILKDAKQDGDAIAEYVIFIHTMVTWQSKLLDHLQKIILRFLGCFKTSDPEAKHLATFLAVAYKKNLLTTPLITFLEPQPNSDVHALCSSTIFWEEVFMEYMNWKTIDLDIMKPVEGTMIQSIMDKLHPSYIFWLLLCVCLIKNEHATSMKKLENIEGHLLRVKSRHQYEDLNADGVVFDCNKLVENLSSFSWFMKSLSYLVAALDDQSYDEKSFKEGLLMFLSSNNIPKFWSMLAPALHAQKPSDKLESFMRLLKFVASKNPEFASKYAAAVDAAESVLVNTTESARRAKNKVKKSLYGRGD